MNEAIATILQAALLLCLLFAWLRFSDNGKKHTFLSWIIGVSFFWAWHLFKRVAWPIALVVIAAFFLIYGINTYDNKHHGRQNKRVVN